jgi:hypothetical protein
MSKEITGEEFADYMFNNAGEVLEKFFGMPRPTYPVINEANLPKKEKYKETHITIEGVPPHILYVNY